MVFRTPVDVDRTWRRNGCSSVDIIGSKYVCLVTVAIRQIRGIFLRELGRLAINLCINS